MEGYHELSFSSDQIPNLDHLLSDAGYQISHSDESWLGPKYPEYGVIVLEHDEHTGRACFALTRDEESSRVRLVYVNDLNDSITKSIRSVLEDHGAIWTYWAP